jgi:hypothetical protein
MSQRHRRDGKPSSSHLDKAKLTIRQAFNKPSYDDDVDDIRNDFNFNLYESGRQDRINEIADDEDGDLIVERQPINSEKTSKIIEANDRRHDAVIFGDKTIEGN